MCGHTPDVKGLWACYFLSLTLITAALLYSLYKISYLSRINFAQDPVTTTRERIELFRLRMLKGRVLELILFPPLLLAIYVVINYWVHQQNILDDLESYAPRTGIAIAIGIPAVLYVYGKIYFRNPAQLKENLKEIDGFVQD
jgi:hypothetical protein